jgi:LysR family transcriptional regulator, hydrogen peroxide-inducible genes activator
LIALPDQPGEHRTMPLFREPFVFAGPAGHKLSNRPVVTERELSTERLLLLEEGHCLRDQALAVCGQRFRDDDRVNDDFRATSLETIAEMVAAGIGCTLLPAMAVPHLTERHRRLEIRPLHAGKAHRHIGLMWRASFPRGEDLGELGRFIQELLPDSVEVIRPAPVSAMLRRTRSPPSHGG